MTPFPDTLDVDAHGYPSDARLEQIKLADDYEGGRAWMVETFPKLAASLAPYATCRVMDGGDILGRPVKHIEFSTGGWSGCEDFIDAVCASFIGTFYHQEWRRGGHYVFEVPA